MFIISIRKERERERERERTFSDEITKERGFLEKEFGKV